MEDRTLCVVDVLRSHAKYRRKRKQIRSPSRGPEAEVQRTPTVPIPSQDKLDESSSAHNYCAMSSKEEVERDRQLLETAPLTPLSKSDSEDVSSFDRTDSASSESEGDLYLLGSDGEDRDSKNRRKELGEEEVRLSELESFLRVLANIQRQTVRPAEEADEVGRKPSDASRDPCELTDGRALLSSFVLGVN